VLRFTGSFAFSKTAMPTLPPDLRLPLALFVLFGLLSAAGAYLALNALRGRRAAILGGVGTAGFFVLLLVVVLILLKNAGLVP
jgi:drug/metabolite transporter superfamily protein YnfA